MDSNYGNCQEKIAVEKEWRRVLQFAGHIRCIICMETDFIAIRTL